MKPPARARVNLNAPNTLARKRILTDDTERIDPRRSQRSMLREHVKHIRRDGDSGGESREAVKAPSESNTNPMEVVLERLTKDYETSDADNPGRVYTP